MAKVIIRFSELGPVVPMGPDCRPVRAFLVAPYGSQIFSLQERRWCFQFDPGIVVWAFEAKLDSPTYRVEQDDVQLPDSPISAALKLAIQRELNASTAGGSVPLGLLACAGAHRPLGERLLVGTRSSDLLQLKPYFTPHVSVSSVAPRSSPNRVSNFEVKLPKHQDSFESEVERLFGLPYARYRSEIDLLKYQYNRAVDFLSERLTFREEKFARPVGARGSGEFALDALDFLVLQGKVASVDSLLLCLYDQKLYTLRTQAEMEELVDALLELNPCAAMWARRLSPILRFLRATQAQGEMDLTFIDSVIKPYLAGDIAASELALMFLLLC